MLFTHQIAHNSMHMVVNELQVAIYDNPVGKIEKLVEALSLESTKFRKSKIWNMFILRDGVPQAEATLGSLLP
jgi:hypothetical protein